ncbi:hypothetical protein OS493_036203, partial [Desmophyllum pertusum]
ESPPSHLKRKESSSITQHFKDLDAGEPARKLSSGSGTQDPGQASHVSAESAGANTKLQCGPVMEQRSGDVGTRSSSTQDPHPKATTGVRA